MKIARCTVSHRAKQAANWKRLWLDALRLLELTGGAYEELAEYQQLKRMVEEQTQATEQALEAA